MNRRHFLAQMARTGAMLATLPVIATLPSVAQETAPEWQSVEGELVTLEAQAIPEMTLQTGYATGGYVGRGMARVGNDGPEIAHIAEAKMATFRLEISEDDLAAIREEMQQVIRDHWGETTWAPAP